MKTLAKLLVPFLCIAVFAGCTAVTSSTNTTSDGQVTYEDPNFYYDFDDILIPKELNYKDDESYNLDNRKFRAGIMKFSGRIESADLVQFFQTNMTSDNWETTSAVKGPLSVLSFEKPNKSCIIQIEDGLGSAKVTIIAVETKVDKLL